MGNLDLGNVYQAPFRLRISGNECEDRESYENKPKKYRIVEAEFVQKKNDLKTSKQSELPFSTQCLLEDITYVNMIKKSCDETSIPFEIIIGEVVI